MEDQKDVRLPKVKKVYNWEVPMDQVDLLKMIAGALNELPNKRLKHNHFPNTYAIASCLYATLEKIKEENNG